MTVITSLTMRVADPTTITASDGDGNSISCSAPRADRFDMVEVWRAYLGFAQDGVEEVHLHVKWNSDAPYEVIRGLSNIETVHVARRGARMERVIDKLIEALTHPSRGSQGNLYIVSQE